MESTKLWKKENDCIVFEIDVRISKPAEVLSVAYNELKIDCHEFDQEAILNTRECQVGKVTLYFFQLREFCGSKGAMVEYAKRGLIPAHPSMLATANIADPQFHLQFPNGTQWFVDWGNAKRLECYSLHMRSFPWCKVTFTERGLWVGNDTYGWYPKKWLCGVRC